MEPDDAITWTDLEREIKGVRDVANERDRRYEDRFKAMDEKTGLALTAAKEAVIKAEAATEKRFDAVNEFRGTLSDQATNLMPRGEANAKFTALEKDVSNLKEEVTKATAAGVGGKAVKDESRANLGTLFGAVALAATLAALVARWMK